MSDYFTKLHYYVRIHRPTRKTSRHGLTFDEILEQTARAGLPHGSPDMMLRNLVARWNKQQPKTWRYRMPGRRR